MKKIVMIHTSPVSLDELKKLVNEIIPNTELVNIIDDSLLEEVKKNNGITPSIIARMNAYVQIAQSMAPDLIFNQCSSVGEAFDIAKKATNVKTLKIDEPMAEAAVKAGKTIGVVATVKSTMKPSCRLIERKAKEKNRIVKIKEFLVDGALDVLMKENNVKKHNEMVLKKIQTACGECDVVVLAQGSMTAILPYLKGIDKPVLTSPKLAIEKARDILYE